MVINIHSSVESNTETCVLHGWGVMYSEAKRQTYSSETICLSYISIHTCAQLLEQWFSAFFLVVRNPNETFRRLDEPICNNFIVLGKKHQWGIWGRQVEVLLHPGSRPWHVTEPDTGKAKWFLKCSKLNNIGKPN